MNSSLKTYMRRKVSIDDLASSYRREYTPDKHAYLEATEEYLSDEDYCASSTDDELSDSDDDSLTRQRWRHEERYHKNVRVRRPLRDSMATNCSLVRECNRTRHAYISYPKRRGESYSLRSDLSNSMDMRPKFDWDGRHGRCDVVEPISSVNATQTSSRRTSAEWDLDDERRPSYSRRTRVSLSEFDEDEPRLRGEGSRRSWRRSSRESRSVCSSNTAQSAPIERLSSLQQQRDGFRKTRSTPIIRLGARSTNARRFKNENQWYSHSDEDSESDREKSRTFQSSLRAVRATQRLRSTKVQFLN